MFIQYHDHQRGSLDLQCVSEVPSLKNITKPDPGPWPWPKPHVSIMF